MTPENFKIQMENVYKNLALTINWGMNKNSLKEILKKQARVFDELIYEQTYNFSSKEQLYLILENTKLCNKVYDLLK